MVSNSRILFHRFWLRESWTHPIVPDFHETIDSGFPAEFDWESDGEKAPYRISVSMRGAPENKPEALVIDPAVAGAKAARRRWIAGLVAHRNGSAPPLNGSVPVELHLPCTDRRSAPNWQDEACQARVTEDGAIYLQDTGVHQARVNAALAILFRESRVAAPFHSRFTDVRTMDQETALYQLPPILDRYGLGDGWKEWMAERPGHHFDVSILLRLKADAAQAWVEIPGPRQATFYDRLIQLSNAVQESLRVWLSYLYFQDIKIYHDPAKAWPMIVFTAMKPFRSKSRADYSYEVTDHGSIQRALWGVLPALEDEMRRIAPRLASFPITQQQMYSQRRTPEMVREAGRFPRLFGALLFGEREMVEAFLRFAQHIHETLPVGKPDGVVKHGSALFRKVERRLASLYGSLDFGHLAPMVLMEATSALAAATGYSYPVEAMIRIRDREESADYYSANSSFTG